MKAQLRLAGKALCRGTQAATASGKATVQWLFNLFEVATVGTQTFLRFNSLCLLHPAAAGDRVGPTTPPLGLSLAVVPSFSSSLPSESETTTNHRDTQAVGGPPALHFCLAVWSISCHLDSACTGRHWHAAYKYIAAVTVLLTSCVL